MSQIREDVRDLMAGRKTKHTRRPLERMHRIHEAILEGGLPTCTQLAEQLEVTPKTVQRDIDFMRDSLRMPLDYDSRHHGWRYTEAVVDFPAFKVGAEELAALFFARSALESIRGTELATKLRDVFGQLSKTIGERVDLRWSDLDEAFTRKVPEVGTRELKLFGQLAEAVVHRREIGFHYRKLGADEAGSRKVRPLHLGEVEGSWYLIAHDLDREALRTFALPRITRLRVSERHFEVPPDFDGRKYLSRSFGIWSNSDDPSLRLVRVVLKDYAARLAQERRWHPTQEIRVLDAMGDRVEVCFEAGALEEVVRWVLSFGSKAQVLGPEELKKMVRKELRLMKA